MPKRLSLAVRIEMVEETRSHARHFLIRDEMSRAVEGMVLVLLNHISRALGSRDSLRRASPVVALAPKQS